MPARVLPNLGLKAFFIPGEDGWGADISQNFLKLSSMVQAGVNSMVTTLPTTPTEGDIFLLSATASTNPNKVAIYDAGVWNYLPPLEGWMVFNRTIGSFQIFNQTEWKIVSLAKLVEITARDIGTASSTSLLDRATADVRYAASTTDNVTSFNTRAGAITLTQADVAATGFTGAVASFNGRTGAITLTQADVTGLVLNLTHLDDVPASYVGQAGRFLRVNSGNTGVEFTTNHLPVNVLTANTTLGLTHGGAYIRVDSATAKTLTIPFSSTTEFPLGTKIIITQAGDGAVIVAGAGGVQIDTLASYQKQISVKNGVATLIQYGVNQWQLFGDLKVGASTDNTETSIDTVLLSADNVG